MFRRLLLLAFAALCACVVDNAPRCPTGMSWVCSASTPPVCQCFGAPCATERDCPGGCCRGLQDLQQPPSCTNSCPALDARGPDATESSTPSEASVVDGLSAG